MVIEQVQGFAQVIRSRIDTVLDKLGINTYTLTNITRPKNSMGRLAGRTKVTSTIKGFLNKTQPQDKQFQDLGVVNVGEASFYTNEDVSINENDELTESGETDIWIFTKRIDHEKIQGDVIFQSWAMTKKV